MTKPRLTLTERGAQDRTTAIYRLSSTGYPDDLAVVEGYVVGDPLVHTVGHSLDAAARENA